MVLHETVCVVRSLSSYRLSHNSKHHKSIIQPTIILFDLLALIELVLFKRFDFIILNIMRSNVKNIDKFISVSKLSYGHILSV
jgi:uncharacterized membrane protein